MPQIFFDAFSMHQFNNLYNYTILALWESEILKYLFDSVFCYLFLTIQMIKIDAFIYWIKSNLYAYIYGVKPFYKYFLRSTSTSLKSITPHTKVVIFNSYMAFY